MRQQGRPINIDVNSIKFDGRKVVGFALIAIIAIAVISSVYTVEPEEVGVVLTLGRYTRTTEPGLHFRLPLGIDKVYKVPV
ncbi:MAG: FtsH protease activity modulator HflK, partial [Gemmatimonadetes bacterium]|nr:FtsH protease activity modulator HflK [Gemmatimonadota bacterium]